MTISSIRRHTRRVATATVVSGVLAAGALALTTSAASASTTGSQQSGGYRFSTVDNARDLTFNQLLGINDLGEIAGYFGSGAAGHPNQGYRLVSPYIQRNFINENFPGSVQTQVTGLNNRGVTVGFWSSMNNASMVNDNHGFYAFAGQFHTADFPAGRPATPPVDQLLGVNDSDVAVGFYTDANGSNHGYEYNIGTHRYGSVADPNAPGTSLTAAAINDEGDVAGFYVDGNGNTDGLVATPQH
jgi:hypothetical protein